MLEGEEAEKLLYCPHSTVNFSYRTVPPPPPPPQTQDYTYRYIQKVNNKLMNGRKEGKRSVLEDPCKPSLPLLAKIMATNFFCITATFTAIFLASFPVTFIAIPHRSCCWAPSDTLLLARCHFTGPKKLSNSRAEPPPTFPFVMDLPASKPLCTRPYKS